MQVVGFERVWGENHEGIGLAAAQRNGASPNLNGIDAGLVGTNSIVSTLLVASGLAKPFG